MSVEINPKWMSKFKKFKDCKDNSKELDKETKYWVNYQRKSYAYGNLDTEKINLLESTDFIWNKKEAAWNDRFLELKDFKRINGHTNVSKCNPSHDTRLANFVANQRQAKIDFDKKSKVPKFKMTEERIQMLNSIQFNWKIRIL